MLISGKDAKARNKCDLVVCHICVNHRTNLLTSVQTLSQFMDQNAASPGCTRLNFRSMTSFILFQSARRSLS